MKQCRSCKQWKPDTDFHRYGRNLAHDCKPCHHERNRHRLTKQDREILEASRLMRAWR